MQVKVLLFILLSLGLNVQAETYQFTFQGETVPVNILRSNESTINDTCSKNLKTCQALKALGKSSPMSLNKTSWNQEKYSNPSHQHCREVGGIYVVLRSPRLEEASFCGFKDKSMISSWELYRSAKK